MSRLRLLAVVIVATLLVGPMSARVLAGEPNPRSVPRPAAACPVSEAESSRSAATPAVATTATATLPAVTPRVSGCEVVLTIVDFTFAPLLTEIPVGTTVTWVNVGPTIHTVSANDSVDGLRIWDSNILEVGDLYSYTFADPGTYDYLCTLHPKMTASLNVLDAGSPATPASSVSSANGS